jgi:hypothetical protein
MTLNQIQFEKELLQKLDIHDFSAIATQITREYLPKFYVFQHDALIREQPKIESKKYICIYNLSNNSKRE